MPMLSTIAIISALLSAAFWAVASVSISRFLAGGLVSPAAANLFKNGAAAFTFLLGALIFGGHWPVGSAWAWLFFSGFLGFAVSDTLYFAAFQRCGVQTAATVMLLNVPIATVLALPLAGDKIQTQVIPFAVVVLLGVILVIIDSRTEKSASEEGGEEGKAQGYGLGVLLAVVAAFAIGTSVPLGRGGFGDVSVFPGGFIRLMGGALGAVPLAMLTGMRRESSPGAEFSRLLEPIFAAPGPGSVWGKACLFGVGCAVVGLAPYHYAQRELPSGIATTLFASTPLFTLPLAIILGGRVGWKSVVGTVVGFFGVAGILRYGQGEEAPPQLDLGAGPEVQLTSHGSLTGRHSARRPAFVEEVPFLSSAPDEPMLKPLVAVGMLTPVEGSGPATEEQERRAALSMPILFGGNDDVQPTPRALVQEAVVPEFARGHWADTGFGGRLASGGFLLGTLQSMGGDQLGYGIRLTMEWGGPPGLDLGWLHTDKSDVLHGLGEAVPLRDGGAQVIWVDDRGGDAQPGMGLYRRRVAPDGALGREALVDGSICDCCPPDLVELANGTLLVAYRHRSLDDIRDIYLTRRDPRDGAWSRPAPVHVDGWELDGCPVNGPSIAAAGKTVAVVWFTQAGDASIRELKAAFSRDGGMTFEPAMTILAGETLGRVALVAAQATHTDDRFLLAHLSPNPEGDASGMKASWRAALIGPGGAKSEFVRIADVDGSRSSGRLDLTLARPGVAQAVWTGPTGLASAELDCGAPAAAAASSNE